MRLRLWCPLLELLLMGEPAASIGIPSARARAPRGAQPHPNETTTNETTTGESIWIAGAPGQSCTEACAASDHFVSGACNETMMMYLDTEAAVLNVAVDGNVPCDTSGGFGWSEFPTITTWNNRCSYRRPWQYPASCSEATVPPSHRYCSCSGAWYRGALGESCSATCAAVGGVCEEEPLENCITEECVRGLALRAGFPCSGATIYAKEYPSQLPNGDCAYTYGYQERCHETVSSTTQRICACSAVDLVDVTGQGDPHVTSIHSEKFDINSVGIHSLIRIPGDGRNAGKALELSARVVNLGHLKDLYRCRPYFFDMIDLRGELLGDAVRHIEVLKDGVEGVRFSSVMVDGNKSLLDQNMTARSMLRGGAVFGNVAVHHATTQHKGFRVNHSLILSIQAADPPVEVTVYWWNQKPTEPGLNLRVHGLNTRLGVIGGLMGRDPHGKVSSDPKIKGCPPRGEKPNIVRNFIGNHSMIRIPGDGRRAGKTLELSTKVAHFAGRLKGAEHCRPFYFSMFQLRGELLGGAVDHLEVRRDGAAGVSFSSVMVDRHHSRMDMNLSLPETLKDGAVFGNVAVLHKTYEQHGSRARHSFRLAIQTEPPIEVTVYWNNLHKHGLDMPGLNLRVSGMRTELGTIGGLLGQDPRGGISSDHGINGCLARATSDIPQTTSKATAKGRSALVGIVSYPDATISPE